MAAESDVFAVLGSNAYLQPLVYVDKKKDVPNFVQVFSQPIFIQFKISQRMHNLSKVLEKSIVTPKLVFIVVIVKSTLKDYLVAHG